MEKIPEIVRSRLARRAPESSPHPDANLLAAFAEHTLPEAERAAVVAHLMECADCRECVALALAAAEPEAVLAAQRSAGAGFRGWFREWRWIASAAASCCLVAVTLQYYGAPPARVPAVSVSSKAAGLQTINKLPPQPLASSVPRTVARKQKVEARPGGKKEAPVLVVAEEELAPEDIVTQATPPAVQVQNVEPPVALSGAEVAKADTASTFLETGRSAENPGTAPRPAAPASAAGMPAAAQGLAVRTSGLVASAPVFRRERKNIAPKALAPESSQVLWSINASAEIAENSRGLVERSTDAGQSWQIVPLSERVNFRAVAAAGPDVWAGGSPGTLFHSADGGAHWVEIEVAGENARWSGDIVRIDARPNLVTISTTSGEEWISADGGKHWKRQ